MTLPRFTRGRWGRLDYENVNEVFDTVDRVNRTAILDAAEARPLASVFAARIAGLSTGAVQGTSQTGAVPAGVTAAYVWCYDFDEITAGIGDAGGGSTRFGSALNAAGETGETTITLDSGAITTRTYALDFAMVQRFAAGDTVVLATMPNREYSVVIGNNLVEYAMIISEPKTHTFLARLTVDRAATGEGLYEWIGLTRDVSGTLATNRLAQNLYEYNGVRVAGTYGTILYAGSQNWGHGQVLTGAGGLGTMTKNPLPVGGAGTGTVVTMHEEPVNHFHFYAVAPVTPACPA